MTEILKVQGRRLAPQDVENIRGLIASHPQWTRWRISRTLARQWGWHNGVGQLKDMAARSLLLKLQERALIQLPPRRTQPPNRMRYGRALSMTWDQEPIQSPLQELEPLRIQEVSRDKAARQLMASGLAQWHYLSHGGTVGENLQYTIWSASARPLAFVLFGAAAWKCQDRDRFIGWTAEQRERQLELIANNSRFLILPWAKVPGLASWILSQISRRVSQDWQGKYGHPIVLLESFVQQDRFQGLAYRAANWQEVGITAGRTRQDRSRRLQAPLKAIYLCPLQRTFREVLCP